MASFVENKHEKFVQLLGLDNENLQSKLNNLVQLQQRQAEKLNGHKEDQENEENLENEMTKHFNNSLNLNHENGFDQIEQQETCDNFPIDFKFSSGNRILRELRLFILFYFI